ncbi:MAG: hypothetical protein WBC91_06685 [Phototrophicaceae bacterium]
MLLRFYRLTDKLGIVLLKLGAASADWLVDGAIGILDLFARSTGGIFKGLLAFVLVIAGALWALIRGIGRGFSSLLRLMGIKIPTVGSARERVATRNADAMARRAARDEIDVVMQEDPLKIQNRRLSFLVLILGVGVLAAVIWATDPSRALRALPVAPIANDSNPEVAVGEPTQVGVNIVAPTQIPTAAPLPEALSARGAVAYAVREDGQTDIWAVNVGASRNAIRITNDAADERDPEWNFDGTRLAYAARTDGNWDLYVYDALQNATGRVTVDLSFQANPTWSPDGVYLAYENYQNDNLDIYALPIDASRRPDQITTDPAPDFSPAWSPGGREIAFVSLRDGNQDIYVINLADFELVNITNTPDIDEDYPAWSPDGRSIAYSALEPQATNETVFIQSLDDLNAAPELVAIGRAPTFAPDGSSIAYTVDTRDQTRTDIFASTIGDGSLPVLVASVLPGATSPSWTLQPLPAALVNAGGLPLGSDDPLYIEQTTTFNGSLFQLQSLGNVQVDPDQVFLSDAVNDSFNALRQAIFEQTNVDYLSALDDAFWSLERPADFGEARRNWHRTGRAVALPRNGLRGFPPPIEVVRETIGNEVYWRVFVRVDEDTQRGQLGEPLRDFPWDFLSTETDVDAYAQGGRERRIVPSGYYVDFTVLADDYDWERIAAGSDWIANERARNFWLFINDDNLSWCDAMLQLYSEDVLVNYECTS